MNVGRCDDDVRDRLLAMTTHLGELVKQQRLLVIGLLIVAGADKALAFLR